MIDAPVELAPCYKHPRATYGPMGDITLLGPLDLDPSYNQAPRVTLRSSGVRLWDIIVRDLYGGNALVFQTPSGGKVAFTPDDETFFNTTLSVLREAV
eukprot:symbB.v1.2.011609.t1/scaffold783.1/size170700/3